MATLESFDVETTGDNLWRVWGKNAYSERAIQASCELVDNAISAILTLKTLMTIQRKILFHFNEVDGTASIEDNGPGFSTLPSELKRCWSYGSSNPRGLNEHGCGAKTALSIFDTTGRGWKVYWKSPDHNTIYMIQGPLRQPMRVHRVSTWPGILTETTGVYMSFPCSNECFRSLYGPNKGTVQLNDALARFRCELAQYYYYQPNIANGTIHLVVNGERVTPFTIDLDSDAVLSHTKFEFPLDDIPNTTNKVHGVLLHLNAELKNSWFKVNQNSMGLYLWKNGRYIEHIKAGELFEMITGKKAHPTLSGRIVLVNLSGDQTVLPATDPNKTRWMVDSEAFQSFAKKLSVVVSPFFKGEQDEVYERDLVRAFTESRRLTLRTIVPGYTCSVNRSLNHETPPLDIVEEFPETNRVRIYEAKRSNQATVASIGQLIINFLLAKRALESSGRTIEKAILLLNCGETDAPMDAGLETMTRHLMEDAECPLEIHSYSGGLLWPRQQPAAMVPRRGRGRPRKTG